MEDIYISSDSLESSRSTIVNVSSPPNVQSPPSKFNSLFNGNVKRCSQCLTSIVHFLIICSVCNKLSCCKCIYDAKRCCGIYLLSKVNKICRTPHYPCVLSHSCHLNQTHPPVSKYFDDSIDNFVQHGVLAKAKFILNLLTNENVNNADMVFVLTIKLVKCINKLEDIFVHILFKNYVCTSMLMNNMGQINGENLPQLDNRTVINDQFRWLYDHVRSTQAHTRRNKIVKTVVSQGLLLVCFLVATLVMLL